MIKTANFHVYMSITEYNAETVEKNSLMKLLHPSTDSSIYCREIEHDTKKHLNRIILQNLRKLFPQKPRTEETK